MTETFRTKREDGRSDRQVIFDLAKDIEAGALLPFDTLLNALKNGLSEEELEAVNKNRVYRAVAVANKRLLSEHQRYLHIVRGKGYRMISAEEHLPLAISKKETAQDYLKKGIDLLRNTRMDELSQSQRTLHEGQLLVLGGLYQAYRNSERRHNEQESAIDKMLRQQRELAERLDKLETKGTQ